MDWIYVDDVVDGLIAAVASDNAVGGTVDIGTGRFATVRDVILEIARQMDWDSAIEFESIAERPMEQARKADVAATADLIGWRPRIALEEGLRRTIAYYRDTFEA